MVETAGARQRRHLKLVGVGGTFDILHAGHKALIREALRCAQSIQIGLSSDEFVKRMRKAHDVRAYEDRARSIRRFLEKEMALRRAEILPIENPYGTATTSRALEGLVVSTETLSSAEDINRVRRESGLPLLKLIVVKLVSAEDGRSISTRRIRKGEIARSGRIAKGHGLECP